MGADCAEADTPVRGQQAWAASGELVGLAGS
jgi:hypothetical protein